MSRRGHIRKRLRLLRDAKRPDQDTQRTDRLEKRLEHLETLVEGLQDAVHRDSVRHEQRMSALEERTEPESLARTLSDDVRRRGL